MISISEAITTIKKAENDANKLIEDTKQESSEMKEQAREKANATIKAAKDEAQESTGEIIFKAEDDAKKETIQISKQADENVKNIKNQATGKIEGAVDIIVKNVL